MRRAQEYTGDLNQLTARYAQLGIDLKNSEESVLQKLLQTELLGYFAPRWVG